MHLWLENWIRGKEQKPMTAEVEPYVRSLLPLLETVSETSLVEAPVLHEGLGFGEEHQEEGGL